jgi:type I restriction enzyme S subunit
LNKIDSLLKTLCPNGVPFVKLGELEDQNVVKLGRGDVISKIDLNANPGSFPVYSSSAASNGLFGRFGKFMFDDERITWSIDGGGKFFYREPHKYSVTNVCGWLSVLDKEQVNTRYLYFALISIWGGRTYNYTVKAHPSVIREDYLVPLPPLEIQIEVVRILDKFTDLEADLVAELEARKTQFEYIRTELIRDCIEKYPSVPIGSMISHLRTGLNPRQNFVLNPPGAKCSYITVRELDGFGIRTTDKTDKVDEHGFAAIQNRSKLQAGDVLFSATGTIGRTALVENTPTDWGIKEGVYAITTDSAKLHPRFLIYLFGHSTIYDEIIARSEGSTVRSISMASLKALMIPAPQIAVQKSIVDKLDVTYELAFGLLPKEIAARKQQYEYYRGKLLTFKELENA